VPLKRDPSLIPLSHGHHHALVRVFEIRRALAAGNDPTHEKTVTCAFHARELVPHFEAEEEALVPALRDVNAVPEAEIALLVEEHRLLDRMVAQLGQGEGDLAAFADLLEKHIRTEERRIFAAYQEQVSSERRTEVGESIRRRLGRPS
jgi:hypothetical protein